MKHLTNQSRKEKTHAHKATDIPNMHINIYMYTFIHNGIRMRAFGGIREDPKNECDPLERVGWGLFFLCACVVYVSLFGLALFSSRTAGTLGLRLIPTHTTLLGTHLRRDGLPNSPRLCVRKYATLARRLIGPQTPRARLFWERPLWLRHARDTLIVLISYTYKILETLTPMRIIC